MISVEYSTEKKPSWKSSGEGLGFLRLTSFPISGTVEVESSEYDKTSMMRRETYNSIPFEKLAAFVDEVRAKKGENGRV